MLFCRENVRPNVMKFDSLSERFEWLFENDFLEREFIKKYNLEFIEKLYAYLNGENFKFKSFMAAFKFYNQYALKTNDGQYYIETYVDRVAMNALYYADGDEVVALRIADEMIHQRYQPATPSFFECWPGTSW